MLAARTSSRSLLTSMIVGGLLATSSVALAGCEGGLSMRPSETDASAPADLDAARREDRDAQASEEDASVDGALDGAVEDAAPSPSDAAAPADAGVDAHVPAPCVTRVTYGSAWIHGAGHDAQHDDASGEVTWDGACVNDGANSYALLSNGWRPYFSGRSACVIALDRRGECPSPPPACRTRVTYASTWIHGADHPAQHDDVSGVVTWSGQCEAAGADSRATLSNGWAPHFRGSSACGISLRYEQCGGLYANPVIDRDCPDPGVVRDGDRYVLTCTSGGASAAYPIYTSPDLVRWTRVGHVFPAGTRPSWASGDFWAPEIHRVGSRWIAYFSARRASDGRLVVGAATAPSATGPFTDLGRPLVDGPSPGVIDVSYFEASDGRRFLLYKVDGNAVGARTPILIRPLNEDGVSFSGAATEILSNDRAWEGALVEGPWMIERDGYFYLFYSGNGYATTRYAAGVARSRAPTGPFTKASAPILVSNAAWGGPGHGSIVRGPSGSWVHVYHAWVGGHVGGSPGRLVLADRVGWTSDGWPTMYAAPGALSMPPP